MDYFSCGMITKHMRLCTGNVPQYVNTSISICFSYDSNYQKLFLFALLSFEQSDVFDADACFAVAFQSDVMEIRRTEPIVQRWNI